MSKPNVIVICIDSLRADCVGPEKAMDFVETPHLDRLASESVVFDKCHAEALPTIQVRRCLFTGHRSFPWRQAIPDEGLQPAGPGWRPISHGEDTLADVLHDAGYVTGLVADTYHMFKPTMNFMRGFLCWQFVRGQENDPFRSGPFERIDMESVCPKGEATPAHHPTIAQYLLNALDRRGEEDWQCAQVFTKAAQWLEDNRGNSLFFLWVDSFTPHELRDPPRYHADWYCPPKPGVKDLIYLQAVAGKTMTAEENERCKALYLGFVTFVDRWVGHLLETAENIGLLDDTVILFTTDHAAELRDKGRFGTGGDRLFPYNTRDGSDPMRPPGAGDGGTTEGGSVCVCGRMAQVIVACALGRRAMKDERCLHWIDETSDKMEKTHLTQYPAGVDYGYTGAGDCQNTWCHLWGLKAMIALQSLRASEQTKPRRGSVVEPPVWRLPHPSATVTATVTST